MVYMQPDRSSLVAVTFEVSTLFPMGAQIQITGSDLKLLSSSARWSDLSDCSGLHRISAADLTASMFH